MASNVQKKEAIQNCPLTTILNGPESNWRVSPEIGYRHFSAGHEGSDRASQAKRDERTSHEFNAPCDQTFRVAQLARTTQNTEQLLGAMAGKQ
jgi:hypothetical protein